MSTPPAAHPQRARRADRFVVVLVLLTTSYILFAISSAQWARTVVAVLYVLALVVAVQASDPAPRQRQAVLALVVLGVVASLTTYWTAPQRTARGVTDVMLTLLLAATLTLLLNRVLRHRTVTIQTIAGALSAYLLIGMTFTSVYGVLTWLSDEPFFSSGAPQNIPDLQYFSFTTLTTLGYGDLTAASSAGRGLATFEALVGQIFLATLVASLVASFRVAREKSTP